MKFSKKDLAISSLFAILMLVIINLDILLFITPQHVKLYSHLGMKLPYLTALLLTISHAFSKMLLILIPILFVVFIIFAVLVFTLKKESILAAIYIAIASLLLIFALLSVYAIKLPFIRANQAIKAAGLTVPEPIKK